MDTQGTIHALFEEQSKKKPNNIAILSGKSALTYEELNKKANQLAHYLLSKDITPDTPIAFCMERSLACLITILAILKVGGAYLPLDSSHPEERLLLILNNSKNSLLISQSAYKEKFTQYHGTLILLDQIAQEIDTQSTQNPDLVIPEDRLAYVIYTSGSTGVPKGVLIEHNSVVNYTQWLERYANIQPRQHIDFSSNHTFDMAVTTSIAPLMLGLTIVICDNETKKNVRNYLTYLKSTKVNIIKITPSYFKLLLYEVRNKFIALPYLKTIILGGENLSSAECRAWLKLYPEHILYNEYGPTETTVGVSQFKICSDNILDLGVSIPIGKIGENIKYYILDTNNNPISHHEVGELYLGGACLARGYLNQPEITQEHFISDPFSQEKNTRLYKTGDLCLLRYDGVLEYLGRTDLQLKIRGFRIEPGEIEKHLLSHPAIDMAVVIAQKDSLNEERLLAYYIQKNRDSTLASSELREYLRNFIPEYMIPSAFISINSLPLTANGKLDQSLLLPLQLTANKQYRKPRTDTEKTVTKIWSEELGIKTIGLDDDFYELGGHSLMAARIVSKINQIMKLNLTLRDFYIAPNIAQICILIFKAKKRKLMKPKGKNTLLNTEHDIPLSSFQLLLWLSDTFESKAKKLNITARKRMQGTLNLAALEFAFNTVLKKQEILLYRILKLRPVQFPQKEISFKINEIDLSSSSEQESETILTKSIDQLINYYPWPKDFPLILVKLFHLKNNKEELQICIPHIVCDDFSPEILLSDLSQFYLLYKDKSNIKKLTTDKSYKDYIFNEQLYFKQNIDRSIHFWDQYLKDTGLFTFPSANIVKNMKSLKLSYSTYTTIPESTLHKFKQFCAQSHVSLNEGLCSAIILALIHTTSTAPQKPSIYINIVKSTRDNEDYDDAVGCFLRLEPVKVAFDKDSSLVNVIKQIHQSTIDTSPYQQCPDLVKLSSISTFRQKRKGIRSFITNMITSIYATLFSLHEINRKIFQLCSERISTFKRTNNFLININVQKKFITEPSKNKKNLFGLDTTEISSYKYDLLNIDNVFDVCFIRDENNNSPYLVISANLIPEFRSLVAKEAIKIMETTNLATLQENKGHTEYENII